MTTAIVLSPEAEEWLAFMASQTGRPKATLLSEMIERGLDDVEDYYLAVEVLDASVPARNGSIHPPR